jgi:two-component system, NtrC family, response regulator AtoC
VTQPNRAAYAHDAHDADHSAVMVVDDDPVMCEFLRAFLAERGHDAVTMRTPAEALERYRVQRPSAVILDMAFPGGMDGLEALAAFKKIDRDVPVIVLSGQGNTATVVQAMKLGAADFVSKPFEQSDLEAPLEHALEHRRLQQDVATLRHELESELRANPLIGQSERMAEVHDLIERIADTDVTVLIRGESGTGKELVARAISASSPRRDKPFVKVNCAALPGELLESELFGFERGAFTGALQHKPGKFEFANQGTLFLDEIGDLPLALQSKLLQVLQDGEFARLGGKRDVRVDVRVLAATNRDLERAVADGEFREDLYFRLNVVCVNLPPLRERRQEIPALADHFLKKYSVLYRKRRIDLAPETMAQLMEHEWPGNVRELENLIKRVVVLGSDAAIAKELARAHHFGIRPPPTPIRSAPVAAAPPAQPPPATATDAEGGSYSLKDISRSAAREAERELILKMLQQTRWNRKETAAMLGISYKALLYKIKENGLDKA